MTTCLFSTRVQPQGLKLKSRLLEELSRRGEWGHIAHLDKRAGFQLCARSRQCHKQYLPITQQKPSCCNRGRDPGDPFFWAPCRFGGACSTFDLPSNTHKKKKNNSCLQIKARVSCFHPNGPGLLKGGDPPSLLLHGGLPHGHGATRTRFPAHWGRRGHGQNTPITRFSGDSCGHQIEIGGVLHFGTSQTG